MKDAVGGSILLYLVVIFVSIVIIFFAGIMSYSKAYKIKNRIIEVIERNGTYEENEVGELTIELKRIGYRTATIEQIASKCGTESLTYTNNAGHFYCVYIGEGDKLSGEGYSYEVVTYTHFDFPIIGDLLVLPVKGETKTLGKSYDY